MKHTHLVRYIKAVVAKQGADILYNDKKLVNLIAIQWKNSLEERTLLKQLYEFGSMELLLSAQTSGGDATDSVNSAIDKLSAGSGMSEEDAICAVYEIADMLKLHYTTREQAAKRAKREQEREHRSEQATAAIENASAAIGNAGKIAEGVLDKTKDLAGGVLDKTGKLAEGMLDKTKGLAGKTKDLAGDALNKAKPKAQQLLGKAKGFARKKLKGVVNSDQGDGVREVLSKNLQLFSNIASVLTIALFLVYGFLVVRNSEWIGSIWSGYFDPFDCSFGEYVLIAIVWMCFGVRRRIKEGTQELGDDPILITLCVITFFIPLAVSLGWGEGFLPCLVRLIPSLILYPIFTKLGGRFWSYVSQRESWTSKAGGITGIIFLLIISLVRWCITYRG